MGHSFRIAPFLLSVLILLNPTSAIAEESAPPITFGPMAMGSVLPSAIATLFQSAPAEIESELRGDEFSSARVEMHSLPNDERLRSSLQGDGAVVLFFWSMYCRSCGDLVQEIEKAEEWYAGHNVDVLPVHLFESNPATVSDYLARAGVQLPMLLAPAALRDLFSINILPTTLIYDKEHRLRARINGSVSSEGIRLELMRIIDAEPARAD